MTSNHQVRGSSPRGVTNDSSGLGGFGGGGDLGCLPPVFHGVRCRSLRRAAINWDYVQWRGLAARLRHALMTTTPELDQGARALLSNLTARGMQPSGRNTSARAAPAQWAGVSPGMAKPADSTVKGHLVLHGHRLAVVGALRPAQGDDVGGSTRNPLEPPWLAYCTGASRRVGD